MARTILLTAILFLVQSITADPDSVALAQNGTIVAGPGAEMQNSTIAAGPGAIAQNSTAGPGFAANAPSATYTVNDAGDEGDGNTFDGICDTGNAEVGFTGRCTLRAAWLQADATLAADKIVFALPGPPVIVTSGMPEMTSPISIDGRTANGNVVLDGSTSAAGWSGLTIAAGGSVVENLIIHSFKGSGILLTTATGTIIRDCWIGVDENGAYKPNGSAGITTEASPTGIARNVVDGIVLFDVSSSVVIGNLVGLLPLGLAPMNKGGEGITVFGGEDNRIGGPAAEDRNVVSGFGGHGIAIGFGATRNTVEGNYVGTDITGTLAVPNGIDGVHIAGGLSNTIRGNVISGNGTSTAEGCAAFVSCDGVDIREGSMANVVIGNRIGINAAGTTALGNQNNGVYVGNARGNRIGGPGGDFNVISGNGGSGVLISGGQSMNNIVAGNWIGVDAGSTGTIEIPNQEHGILVDNAPANGISAPMGSGPNIISGNGGNGIYIRGQGAAGNVVAGARIGLDKDGLLPAPNGGHGILIEGATNTRIGHEDFGGGSRIAYNAGDGVRVMSGTGNAIRGNTIYSNDGVGIDLGGDGVTFNDAGDSDQGANGLQNFPVILQQEGRVVEGRLNSLPSSSYTLEFFTSPEPDPTGFGEGEVFLGSIAVTTDGDGNAPFTFTAPFDVEHVTSTATDASGNTSEFSRGRVSLTVNRTSDEPDADPNDGTCDVDLNTPGDQCTLRAAIQQAEATAGESTIDFDIPEAGKQQHIPTIRPDGPLPEITRRVVIDGTTQPGSGWVELDGSNAGDGTIGLRISGGSSRIRGLIINNFKSHGIRIANVGSNAISGNRIGTNAAGSAAAANGGSGILIENSAGNLIGGGLPLELNVISGNGGHGILITGAGSGGTEIQGNWIGIDAGGSGTTDIPNGGSGIRIIDAGGSLIGSLQRNIVSGNIEHGVHISGNTATGHRITGNWIGTDKGGGLPAENQQHGVFIDGASDNFVGGTESGAGNVIAFNRGDGARVVDAMRVRIRQNNIHSNGGLGIDLGGDGVTLNDPNDNVQDFPVFTAQEIGETGSVLRARLEGLPSTTYAIDVFANTVRDESGFGEGERYLGSQDVPTDVNGLAVFEMSVSGEDRNITATATDPDGNTSEFSRGIASLIVNTTSDKPDASTADGACDIDLDTPGDQCSLRAAIQVANANFEEDRITGNIDRIRFDIPGPGVHTIRVDGALPTITDRVIIEATTQPGYEPGQPLIELDGSGAGTSAHGLVITAGESVIRGLIINRFDGHGIHLRELGANTIQANFIGTDAAGTTTEVANDKGFLNGGPGILIDNVPFNLIGGTDEASSNVISGNFREGILIEGANATGNKVFGNRIGTAPDGGRIMKGNGPAMTNSIGIRILGAPDNRIGIEEVVTIVSGNHGHGIMVQGEGATGNVITNSRIGLGVPGGGIVPNGRHGIYLSDAPENTIGGRNRIAGNDSSGVALRGSMARGNVIQGNDVGLDTTIEDPTDIGNRVDGILIDGAPENTVGGTQASHRNVISGNGVAGIRIRGEGARENVVAANYIGTGLSGDHARPNLSGVVVIGAPTNVIGGREASRRNVISGNRQDGIRVNGAAATGNEIIGNYVGTNASGTRAIPNEGVGVDITNAPDNRVGLATDVPGRAPGNVIAGNLRHGIEIFGADARGTRVSGNSIGAGVSVTDTLGNGRDGVRIANVSDVSIGGINDSLANRIWFNGEDGIRITANSDDESIRNSLQGNSIFANGGLGIDLGDDGVNPPFNPNTRGINRNITPPQLTTLERTADSTVFSGGFISWPHQPNGTFEIEFFANANASCDPSDYGEGRRLLGRQTVTTSAAGSAPVRFAGTRNELLCTAVTATATSDDGSTSEFSKCLINKEGCLAFAEGESGLQFRHQKVVSGVWVEVPDSTTDGNRVRIVSRVRNHAAIPLDANLRYLDIETDTALRDSLNSDRQSVTFPASADRDVSYRWNTNGFSWNDDGVAHGNKPQSDRTIKVLLEDGTAVIDSVQKEIVVLPRPVVLVHGLWSNAAVWDSYKQMLRTAHPRWKGFAVGDARASGRMDTGIFILENPIGAFISNTLEENAALLKEYIDGVRLLETAHHVDIVAHSMGGLISRYYLDELMPDSRDSDTVVRELAMLATPNMGSPCADDAKYAYWTYSLLSGKPQALLSDPLPPNLRQLTTAYVDGELNRRITNRHGIPFSISAGNPNSFTCHRVTSVGDGVVETTSALAEERLAMARDVLHEIGHTDFPHDLGVFESWVMPRLDDGPGDVPQTAGKGGVLLTEGGNGGTPAAPAAEHQRPQYIDAGAIGLPRSEMMTVELAVPAATYLGITLQAPDAVSSTLRDPGGVAVRRIEAGAFEASQFFRTLVAEHPRAGTWTLELTHDHAEFDSLAVFFSVWIYDGARMLDLEVSARDEAGNRIALSELRAMSGAANRLHVLASLTDVGRPLVGETVEAMLLGTGGMLHTITLVDDGAHGDGAPADGIYGNSSDVLAPGIYVASVDFGTGADRRIALETVDLTSSDATASGANLFLRKSVSSSTARRGEEITYSITAINSGPETAAGVRIDDPMPDGLAARSATTSLGSCAVTAAGVSCDIGALPAGESVTVELTAGILEDAGEELVNTALVETETFDPNLHNNRASVVVNVSGGTATEAEVVPVTFDLKPNYPNPFNPATTIGFDVSEATHVRLALYDALGRRVTMLVDGLHAPGRYETTLDASGLPSGTYVYAIEIGNYRAHRVMVLLK